MQSPTSMKTADFKRQYTLNDEKSGGHLKGLTVYTDSPQHPLVKADKGLGEDDRKLFGKVVVLGEASKGVLNVRNAEQDNNGETFTIKLTNAYQANETSQDVLKYKDIGNLVHQNPPAVLEFLGQRLIKGEIYTYADPLVIAVNPYQDVGLATDAVIEKYRTCSDVRKMRPHVFAITRNAVETLLTAKKSQTIMVSGESGAGKTEATKHVMRFCAAGSKDAGTIQTAIMSANPVLEAFGNAMTVRNNNSSRFGRFMQLEVKEGGGFRYGSVRNFLLEKSRVVGQTEGERNYHIFYQLMKASPDLSKYNLTNNFKDYDCFKSTTTTADGIDDKDDFKEVQKSFRGMLLEEGEISSIWAIIASILHLCNVKVDTVTGDESVINDKKALGFASGLLGVSPEKVEEAVTKKISIMGGNKVVANWKPKDAKMLIESLGKSLYDELFRYIITRLNKTIEPPEGFGPFLGLLDIFGFEVFKNNSLEQLFINITNERLQKNFIDVVFDKETKLYRDEGINDAKIEWKSNEPIIKMLCGPRGTVLSTLEDACIAPGANDASFLGTLKRTFATHENFIVPKIGGNSNFVIGHTIGPVDYSADSFVYKNTDILRAELVEMLKESSDSVVSAIYAPKEVSKGKLAKGSLIGSQFAKELESLMDVINQTEPHFVRCVKPNERKAKQTPVWGKMFQQLVSLSIMDALQLAQLGFSYRRPYTDFVDQFKFANLGITDSNREPVDKVKDLLAACRIDPKEWRIGKTMIFMTTDGVKVMNRITRESMMKWAPVISSLEALYWKNTLNKSQAKIEPLLVRFQAAARMKIQEYREAGLA